MGNTVSFIFIAQDRYSRTVKAAERATQGFQRRLKGVRTAAQTTNAKLKTLSKTVKDSGQKFRSFGLAAAAGIVTPLLLLGNRLTNAARDAEETRSKFGTVFKDISKEAKLTANNLAASFGLARTKAQQLLGDTGDLLTGFGFAQKEALDVSKRVNELAVDLASFTNYSGGAEGASAALTKALLGERESLKSLGIAISEKNVEEEIGRLMAQGQRFQTLRQAKAHATLSLAIKQSKNAIGDFARTSDSLANQERILAARTQNMEEAFGRLLLPIKLVIVQGVGRFVTWLEKLSPTQKKWTLIVAGTALALGALAAVLGAVAFVLPGIISGFGLLAAGAAALLSPFVLIPAAVGAVGAALVWAYNKFETFRKIVDEVARVISIPFDLARKSINAFIDKFETLSAIRNKAKEAIGGAISGVKDFFSFGGDVDVNSSSRTDVNVNLRAPAGAIESVKKRTSGQVSGLNVGMNMVTAQ